MQMKKILLIAIIGGVISLIIDFPITIIDFILQGTFQMIPIGILLYGIDTMSYSIFMFGFKIVGDIHKNSLLKVASFFMIISVLITYVFGFFHNTKLISITVFLLGSFASILLGGGFLRLVKIGITARIAGILSIAMGVLYLGIILLFFIINIMHVSIGTLVLMLLLHMASMVFALAVLIKTSRMTKQSR